MAELRELPTGRRPKRTGKPPTYTAEERYARAAAFASPALAAAAARLFGAAPLPADLPDVSAVVRQLGETAADLSRHPPGSVGYWFAQLLYQVGGACWSALFHADPDRLARLCVVVREWSAKADAEGGGS